MSTSNITTARNQNNNSIDKSFYELKDLFDRLDEWESEHDASKESFSYAGIPYCLKRTRETGIDKIFFVGRDYHGKYEDDYCYFTYWDEAKKEFFDDQWGTWAAFPHYDYYEMPISFAAGWEAGLIDKESYLNILKNNALETVKNNSFDRKFAEDCNLRVNVAGGRKWKGEGYLVKIEESSYRFATPRFRNHSENYGITTTQTAVIWNPIDNTLNRANLRYVTYLDEEKIMEQYRAWANEVINKSTIYNIKNMGNFILDIDFSFSKFMTESWMPKHVIGDVLSTAYDPEEIERKKKDSEFRASKMPGIIEWVKNNTDKKDEEIMQLALHIFNKKYGN